MLGSNNPKRNAYVASQIEEWQKEGLISAEQAQILLPRYPINTGNSLQITILMIFGAVLVGLGILLFVASHWEAMEANAKIAILVAAMVGFYYCGWRLAFEPGSRPRLGSALMLIGSIVYGASIWLLAQTYNMDLPLETGLLLWGGGTAFVAFATGCQFQSTLFSILVCLWSMVIGGADSFAPESIYHHAGWLVLRVLCACAVMTLLSLHSRSKIAFAVGTAGSCIAMLTLSSYIHWQYYLLPWGIILGSAYFLCRGKQPLLEGSLLTAGSIAMVLSLLILTFSFSTTSYYDRYAKPLGWSEALLPVLALAVTCAAFHWRSEFRKEAVLSLGILYASLLLAWVKDSSSIMHANAVLQGVCALIVNMIMLATLLGFILEGTRRLQEPKLVTIGICGFVLLIICRYFDTFFSMMDRSLAFTVGGVVLLVAGTLAERGRRKLLEGMK